MRMNVFNIWIFTPGGMKTSGVRPFADTPPKPSLTEVSELFGPIDTLVVRSW